MTSSFLIRPEVVDKKRRHAAVESLRAARVILPSWRELAEPSLIPAAAERALQCVDPDAPDEKNLWRVHWFNGPDRRERIGGPGHVVLPEAFIGGYPKGAVFGAFVGGRTGRGFAEF